MTAVEKEHVLMLVKTYPTPSARYGELVCTAGIRLRDNEWVRIYPYPFRLLNTDQRFRKGDVIEIPLVKSAGDSRPESYKLHDVGAMRVIEHLDTANKWEKRMRYIRPTVIGSVSELKAGMFPKGETVDGKKLWGPSIRPVRVKPGSAKLSWNTNEGWTDKQLENLKRAVSDVQANLFVAEEIKQFFRQLRQVPYEFRLAYTDEAGESHEHKILDWEIAQLYFNARKRVRTDEDALEQVRFKIEDQIFRESNDVHLVLGNVHHRYRNPNNIAIDGFFYPKK